MERASVEAVVERLSERDPNVGGDASAALEWLTAGEEDDAAAVFSRRRLQLFLWYELPQKWLIEPEEQLVVAEALGLFFDELGSQAAALAALCRDPATAKLLREGGKGFVGAIEASGLEPPDTPLLEWSDLMTFEEALERDAVSELLEEAVDDGRLSPGTKGWQQYQAELVERYLIGPDATGTTPLARVRAARREAWLESAGDGWRSLLEVFAPNEHDVPTQAAAEAAVEPMLWLLGRLAGGVKLTQTGALPRALVREAVERYPDWWATDLFGPPHREAEICPLEELHTIVDELKLARPRKGILNLSPLGRTLLADPSALLARIAALIAAAGPLDADLALADLLTSDGSSLDFRLRLLLDPFRGIDGGRYRGDAQVNAGGRTLAWAILWQRAFGSRHSFF